MERHQNQVSILKKLQGGVHELELVCRQEDLEDLTSLECSTSAQDALRRKNAKLTNAYLKPTNCQV